MTVPGSPAPSGPCPRTPHRRMRLPGAIRSLPPRPHRRMRLPGGVQLMPACFISDPPADLGQTPAGQGGGHRAGSARPGPSVRQVTAQLLADPPEDRDCARTERVIDPAERPRDRDRHRRTGPRNCRGVAPGPELLLLVLDGVTRRRMAARSADSDRKLRWAFGVEVARPARATVWRTCPDVSVARMALPAAVSCSRATVPTSVTVRITCGDDWWATQTIASPSLSTVLADSPSSPTSSISLGRTTGPVCQMALSPSLMRRAPRAYRLDGS